MKLIDTTHVPRLDCCNGPSPYPKAQQSSSSGQSFKASPFLSVPFLFSCLILHSCHASIRPASDRAPDVAHKTCLPSEEHLANPTASAFLQELAVIPWSQLAVPPELSMCLLPLTVQVCVCSLSCRILLNVSQLPNPSGPRSDIWPCPIGVWWV